MKTNRKLSCALTFIHLVLFAAWRADAQSPLDGFDRQPNGPVFAITVQADGKILVGGTFTSLGGVPRTNLARLNVDGSVDPTFNPGVTVVHPFVDPSVLCFAEQTDGKILVGGFFTTLGGQSRSNLARLHPDGSVDLTFNPGADNFVYSLAVQADGKIIVGGYFRWLDGQPRRRLGRLQADGTTDTAFAAETDDSPDSLVQALLLQSDGKICVAGRFTSLNEQPRQHLGRLNADGSLDTSFDPGADGPIRGLAGQADGKILVGGFFNTLGGATRRLFGRLRTDGSVDSFDARLNPDQAGFVDGLAVQADGKILIGGVFNTVGGQPRNYLARLNPDASLDTGFGPEANSTVTVLAVQADGKTLVGGHFSSLGSEFRNHLGRLYPDGSVDATFDPGAEDWLPRNGAVTGLAVQPPGHIAVAGYFTSLGGEPRTNFGRLTLEGKIEPGFTNGANGLVNTVITQPDGRTVVGGFFSTLGGRIHQRIGRFNADGTVDHSFNAGIEHNSCVFFALEMHALAAQADGKIVVSGSFNRVNGTARTNLARLHPDGTLDTTFKAGADLGSCMLYSTVRSVAVQADGKILVGGVFSRLAGFSRTNLGRLNPDGSLDAGFVSSANGTVYALAVQADGRILVGGQFSLLDGQGRANLGRLNTDGSVDTSFNPSVTVSGDDSQPAVWSLALQADGKILLGGNFMSVGGQPRQRMARLMPDGAVDPSFSPPLNGTVLSLAIEDDGKILIGGFFTAVDYEPRSSIARLANNTPAFQSLDLDATGTSVTWKRSGSAPEVEQVIFELSNDAIHYASLGTGRRIAGGWELADFPRRFGGNFFLRARGRTVGGLYDGSSGLVESVAQFWRMAPPSISRVQALGGGVFQFSSADPSARSFSVLASDGLDAPLSGWENLGPVMIAGEGLYRFTDPAAASRPRRFYQLRGP